MLRPAQLLRLLYINWVMVRHGLDDLILATHFFRPISFLRYFNPWHWLRKLRGRVPQNRGEQIRLTLEELGPIFVKFGQALSTRRDLLPDDIANELNKLQDRVPPFPGDQAKAIIAAAYDTPLDTIFSEFDERPLASASIAQVHAARLLDGSEVIVKVVRPNIEKTIRRDLDLMYFIADLAERYWREGKRLRPRAVVAEYEKTILDELDLIREAANASQLKRNFQDSDILYIPNVYWHQTRRNVLVMERINGVPVGATEQLLALGVDMKKLSERGVAIFFTQVFRDSFFHADMHPGNIFIDVRDPADPKYIAVDFGIIGTLSPTDQHYLAENFLAFFRRDYRQVAQLHIESGWVPPGTRVDEFESAIRTVSEPIFDRPLKDISFGAFLLTLFQTARRFHMEVQPQLVLLQKTLLNIEGLGRQLNPELDLWQTAKPFLENWMHERIGPKAFYNKLKRNLPSLLEQLPDMPLVLNETLQKVHKGQLQVEMQAHQIEQLKHEIRHANRRNFYTLLGVALLLAAAIILALDGYHPIMLGEAPLLSWIAGTLGALFLLSAWPSSGKD